MKLDRDVRPIAAVVVLGAIMSIFDTTIVNVALDTLGREFHAPLSSVQWVATSYLLALASVVPLTAWAGQRFGEKRVWIASMVVFVLGSILSGLAWSLGSLIAFRAVQGVGGGMIMPTGQAILARVAGPNRMGRMMSIVGVPMLLGPILGPVVGGAIITTLNWRWIFFVNIPIGVFSLVLAARRLPANAPAPVPPQLDWLGLALLCPGLALFVFGLSETGAKGLVPETIVTAAAGAALMGAFVLHAARRGRTALVDLSYFRARGFSAAASVSFLGSFSIFGAMILLPLYYQVARGQTAFTAGLMMAPQGIGAAIGIGFAGRLVDRLGGRRVIPWGLLVASLGTVAYTQLGPDTSYALLAVALFVRGLGFGASVMPSVASAYHALDRSAIGAATTTLNILQRVGGALGVAVMAVVLERRVHAELPVTSSGHGLSAVQAIPPAAREAAKPLLANAFAQTFTVLLATTLLALVPALLIPKRHRQQVELATAEA